ncbi:UNVERIFIED_CONTAM: hypothetical protein BEN50_17210 [Euhalothece sp. KZN 001]
MGEQHDLIIEPCDTDVQEHAQLEAGVLLRADDQVIEGVIAGGTGDRHRVPVAGDPVDRLARCQR